MDYYQDEEFLGRRTIPGITPEMVQAQLTENPIVYKYWKKNPEQIQQRLIDTFMRTPSDSDCPGFIYGFRNLEEYDPKATAYSIKMGRTKRIVPQQRIFQWQRDDCHQYVEMFTIRSEHNMKLEALVHLVFAYARKSKVINGKNRIQWFTFDEKVPTAAATNLLNLMMENIHHRQFKEDQKLQVYERQQELFSQIITKQNQNLRKVLENLKRSINLYAKGRNNKCIQLMKTIVNQESHERVKSVIEELVQKHLALQYTQKLEINVDDDKQQTVKSFKTEVKLLKGSFEKLKSTIVTIQEYESKYKLRFNSILGRVKEAIYLGLKGSEQLDQKVQLYDLDKDNNQVQLQKLQLKLVEQSAKKQAAADKIYNILYEEEQSTASEVRQQKPKSNLKNGSPKSQIKLKEDSYLSKNKLSDVYKYLANIEHGETVINVFQGDFQIDCSKRVTHNIVLLAQSISVYNDWNITFKTDTDSRLNLVIMAKAYTNFDKIKAPKNPQNGTTSLLLLNEADQLMGLDHNLKSKPEKLKSDFCKGIEQIFRRNIK